MVRRLAINVILNWILASAVVPSLLRSRLLRVVGMDVGRNVIIGPGAWFTGRNVSFGDDCFANYFCKFDESAPISIGAGTELGMDVLLVTSGHDIAGPEHRSGTPRPHPITIGTGCWLGARVVVLPGVTVAAGCVIAAGAVVAQDTRPHGLYGGVPARRIRDL